MNRIPIEPGRVVLSRAGRDAGRRFVVLRVEPPFAYVADGDLRRAETPKKKKDRHLKATPVYCREVARVLEGGGTPPDAELRKCLADQPQGEE